MAQITLDLGTATQTQRIIDAFASQYGYQATVQDPAFPNDPTKTIANPETKAAFAKRKVVEYMKAVVQGYEASQAAEAARQTAITNSNTISIV